MRLLNAIILISAICLSFSACSKNLPRNTEAENNTTKTSGFVMPSVPAEITSTAEKSKYLAVHYWDNFNFSDTSYIHQPEITEQAFIQYVQLLNSVDSNTASASIGTFLGQASAEKTSKMYPYFLGFFEKYLYDPSSPLRNEELYIPVTEYIMADSLSTESDKERAKFKLAVLMKNRVGNLATDFTYYLGQGKKEKMHDIKGVYTLLFFYNPGCHACEEILTYMKGSPILTKALQNNLCKFLAFYPENDTDTWTKYKDNFPSTWINGYDHDQIINKKSIYDLRAFPTIYLLDKDKKVLLKDPDVAAVEAYLVEHNPILFSR